MHPENLKWPPVIQELGLGGAGLEPGGRGREIPRGCGQGFSLTLDRACPGRAEPRLGTKTRVPTEGRRLVAPRALLVLAGGLVGSYE